jgi:YgiT-type zinc finger domain-containing protein
MMRRIEDPDFGEVELPPPPSKEEYQRLLQQTREARQKARFWPLGTTHACPQCGERKFVGREDLSYEVANQGRVIIFRHLHGARCEACHAQALEPDELVRIEAEAGVGILADYEAKVSNIGSGTVGTYWPKDVVRIMGLRPDKKAFIVVLDRNTMLLRFLPTRSKGGSKKTKRGRAGARSK